MLVKSLTRRQLSIAQLLRYIGRDASVAGPPLLHNLPLPAGSDLGAAGAAFQANAAFLPARKNGVALYHEILSLAGCDQPRATPAILLDLARRYLELRAPAALAYGRVHFDPALQKNPHVHLAISGNLCGQAKKLRLSKQEFRAVQEELERYQQERYPFLTHSLVFAAPPRDPTAAPRRRSAPPRPESERRSQKKRQLRERYLAARLAAASERDFRFRLQEEGMELYFRGGRLAGVTADGRKYRLQTLGIPDTFAADCAGWQRLPGAARARSRRSRSPRPAAASAPTALPRRCWRW